MIAEKAWVKFERLVTAIHIAKSQGAEVKWNDKINDRQFDVTLRFRFGLHDYLTVIECKDYASKIPVDKVEAFVTKARDANVNKAIMVSSNGYQSGCYEVAQRHGIKLLCINEKVSIDTTSLISAITPALNIYDVYLVMANGEQLRLEEEGGHLDYLMNNIKLISKTRTVTPIQALKEWQRFANPKYDIDRERDATIKLNKNTIAKIPYEGEIDVVAIKFKCKLIEAYLSDRPIFDRHILEGLGKSYELTDEKGEVVDSACLPSLELGFDTKVIPGKFYTSPSIHTYCYCLSIENDIITWILVESYQHGNLLQATMKMNIEFSCYYVEVTDRKKLDRLQRLLEDYLEKKRQV